MTKEPNKISVGIVGAGVIGRRVVGAVRLQPDMALAGVADVAAELGFRVRATGLVTRSQENVPAAVLSALFRLPRPTGDQASLGLAALENGDQAVVALSAVENPEPNPVVLDEQRRQLAELTAGREFSALQRAMREMISVETRLPEEDVPAEEAFIN